MRFVTVVGMVLNIVLAVAKAAGGLLFYSQALLADAVHSLSDLVTDLAVIFGREGLAEPKKLGVTATELKDGKFVEKKKVSYDRYKPLAKTIYTNTLPEGAEYS